MKKQLVGIIGKMKPLILMVTILFGIHGTVHATPISSTDLWNISNGVTIDSTSGVLNYNSAFKSDIRDMFGGATGVIEATNTLFKDFMSPGMTGGSVPAGYTHFVEWSTAADVTLRSFILHAHNEGMSRRSFNNFELFSGDGAGSWSSIYDSGAVTYNGITEFAVDLAAPVVAQHFRMEFIQAAWTDSRAVGPRIRELDGYDTFLDGSTGVPNPVPEPGTFVLLGVGLIGFLGARAGKKG